VADIVVPLFGLDGDGTVANEKKIDADKNAATAKKDLEFMVESLAETARWRSRQTVSRAETRRRGEKIRKV
jgi:hypothetical protein